MASPSSIQPCGSALAIGTTHVVALLNVGALLAPQNARHYTASGGGAWAVCTACHARQCR
ncbi:hypothetical protein HYPSUDRAFT_72335 [Hypholoma sublateritium FD-334 SS-4]|uniref:Uncharacterized protein n=1 Tax=Hypholoma sublateritium (strain FD-334 SS-4) TaxID=945553 RepID=A0A0D2LVK4_HYPSF|nr:hypothetical protein HYPSUDRAFT_72335 [Hypholoma sublateritium FD-334 SS-4]